MGFYQTAALLCFLFVAVWTQGTVLPGLENGETAGIENGETADCREEMYPCTRMYSVHQPMKTCFKSMCISNLRRVYVINNEICVRTVCQQEEILKAELCREKSGWPKRLQRSTRKRCQPKK
ncbi:microfibril associated protein 5 [Trichomycterus rosablanca]|uniref:microfibril associated protein 5 n=1 Tax=Trichomycterus rosablanca TaxID=2290929 RepID=UPI002F3542A4